MALMKFVILAVVVAVTLAHGHKGWRKCGKPSASDKGYAQLDAASKAKVDAVWVNYVNGTNCTAQKAATESIFHAFFSTKFLAQTDAKAANLSAAAQTVYKQQIRPILANTTMEGKQKWDAIVAVVKNAQPTSVQTELQQLKPDKSHKHGKHGHGPKSKSSEEDSTPTPSS